MTGGALEAITGVNPGAAQRMGSAGGAAGEGIATDATIDVCGVSKGGTAGAVNVTGAVLAVARGVLDAIGRLLLGTAHDGSATRFHCNGSGALLTPACGNAEVRRNASTTAPTEPLEATF